MNTSLKMSVDSVQAPTSTVSTQIESSQTIIIVVHVFFYVSVNSKRYHLPGQLPGIRPKLVPGPPGFDLIKCPEGQGFDRRREVEKNR